MNINAVRTYSFESQSENYEGSMPFLYFPNVLSVKNFHRTYIFSGRKSVTLLSDNQKLKGEFL